MQRDHEQQEAPARLRRRRRAGPRRQLRAAKIFYWPRRSAARAAGRSEVRQPRLDGVLLLQEHEQQHIVRA